MGNKEISVIKSPSLQTILIEAKEWPQKLTPFARPIGQEFTNTERSAFISGLQTLIKQGRQISTQNELIQLASDIIRLFETIPLLRDFLLGNIDPATEQRKRYLTIEASKKVDNPLLINRKETQAMISSYTQALIKMRHLFEVPDIT